MNDLKHLTQTITTYMNWLTEQALPLWSQDAIDPHGASYEQLLATGKPDLQVNKRVRVQARQMFVFSVAQYYGWLDNTEAIISKMDNFIEQTAWLETANGFVHLLNNNNEIIDIKQDLYDKAFFILAYAWRYRVYKDVSALEKAEALFAQIELLYAQKHGGWLEGDYPAPFRRQNPHMHLFEALMALYQATNNGKWLAKAGEIFALFKRSFYHHDNGVLLEFFNDDWQVTPQEAGKSIEPGHMMEWVWLLRQYENLTQTPVDDYCFALYHNAIKLGLDQRSNLLYDELDIHGKIIRGTKRCWPMTEWVKASLVQAKVQSKKQSKAPTNNRQGVDQFANVQLKASIKDNYDYLSDTNTALQSLMTYYINDCPTGLYVDQLDKDNRVCSDIAPASTLYHFIAAAIELNN